jgi:Transposase DDE domain group 1
VAFRADAAFAKLEIYDAREARGVDYVIRIPANESLEWEIAELLFRPPGRPSHTPLVRYKSFRYQAGSWTQPRRTDRGESRTPSGRAVPACRLHRDESAPAQSRRGAVLQWARHRGAVDQGGKQAAHGTRLSCHRFLANEVRLQLSVLAYNLGNLWRRLVLLLPKRTDRWSLTSVQQRLVKTGGRLVKHARYYWLLLAESHLPRRLFGAMLERIWALPVPTG